MTAGATSATSVRSCPGCGKSTESIRPAHCDCEHRDPLITCGQCGVLCPLGARFCRGCRASLPVAPEADCRNLTQAPSPEMIFAPGRYHNPPLPHGAFLWLLSGEGQVSRLSLAGGAKPREWTKIASSTAGFNRFAIADVRSKGTWTKPLLVTADPEAVWGVALAEKQATPLYRAPAHQEIIANRSMEQSIRFRGVAVGEDSYTFLVRPANGGDAVLTLRYFAEDRGEEILLRLGGGSFLGPVMEGGLVAVCGERQGAVYRLASQTALLYEFKNFEPLFERSSTSLNVPPAGMPLWAGQGERGLEMRVAGTRQRRTGWLRIYFERQYEEFIPLPDGSCISLARPAGLCVNAVDSLEFVGTDRTRALVEKLEPGMPAGCAGPNVAYFEKSRQPGRHEIAVACGGSVGLELEDRECSAATCCGVSFVGPGLVISYLVSSKAASGRGLRMAYWRLGK